ncbi:transposable element Tc1 transposase [Caerostris extrusa]|uniref:Transposable element Tc1 transposase n=1 Tax=Caerostris extrusa TaxID=172846 RepID=A0AAV4VBP5_CAEEX|nr:transposable element Tc1 transposase [Caerostris extrusa]
MPRSSGADFENGIIIGYHKCDRFLRDISSDLKYPKSTVAYVIKKWKISEAVLWSDESRFTLYRSDGRVWVWRLPGERLLPEGIVPIVKFGGGGIRVWGVSPEYGLGPFVPIHGKLNADAYCTILDDNVLPTLWQFYGLDPVTFRTAMPVVMFRR